MSVKRMDNVGIVVQDIAAAVEFFSELGLELEGRAPIEGDWADGVTGLRGMRVEIAMMRTPDGHGRLELSRFLAPPVVGDHRDAAVKRPPAPSSGASAAGRSRRGRRARRRA
jgi:catechol 2,3-dioxygenase-like lactoylglutathione lyase family enzyme